jgi:ubiquinone/menaquinone biosynthesis C-methylase UbiE
MSSTPPVCDYEGSDYQTSFWDQGGRQYEDAVEVVALKRLLPKSGKLMLELGAGAGRNTLRYTGYERVVLVDYSTTQLQQARERLGESKKYTYVAANIYHLPFVDGLFDGATMIRTLHHLAEARKALDEIHRTLQTGSTFILEYANKRNLKAILRYMLRRQSWSPNSPEPVEWTPLHYDFHPATIRAWLNQAGFTLDRQLTVSHFRVGLLKKIVPLRLLVGLDSLFQPSGGLWQLTPSVFTKSRARGETIPAKAGSFFACPACHAPLGDTPLELICTCGIIWQIENGIYNFKMD